METSLEMVARISSEIAQAHQQLEHAVRDARADGATWAQIGLAAGVTRQAAHERWGHIPRAGCPRAECDCTDHDFSAKACDCGHGPGRGHHVRRVADPVVR